MSVDDEVWTIEVAPARIGATARAYSTSDDFDFPRMLWSTPVAFGIGHGSRPSSIWRPTERWARRAVESMLRKALRAERRARERDDAARVYQFRG